MIGGMRLHVRARITKRFGLVPITTKCGEIHEAQSDLRRTWDGSMAITRPYIAMPPFAQTKDWEYRFSTIFRVDGSETS